MTIQKRLTPTFGKRLTLAREKRGWSASDLARAVDVTPTAVWNWENDRTIPRHLTLLRLAEVLRTSVEFLESGGQPAESDGDAENDLGKEARVARAHKLAKAMIAEAVGVSPNIIQLEVKLALS